MKSKESHGFKENQEKVRVTSKPKTCPICGSSKIAGYLYGLPLFSEELRNNIDAGKIVLGGCCISDDDPKYKCMDCETDFYEMVI